MLTPMAVQDLVDGPSDPVLMREELSQALVEALYELTVLPRDPEGALVGIYAVMEDLQRAIHRAEGCDSGRYARALALPS
jgi:hypothetical protein